MTEKLSTECDFSYLDENYAVIKENIAQAAVASGRRPEDVTFMAVTKTVAPPPINHVISLGVDLIGENKVQELLSKLEFLNTDRLRMHIIGHLQSNKVRKIVGTVSGVESVDSISLAEEISKRCVQSDCKMDVLLEVNIGNEVPPICEGDTVRRYFAKMNGLYLDAKEKLSGKAIIDTLSLGMSADYADAIKEGSTLVRVGSSLFGARRY